MSGEYIQVEDADGYAQTRSIHGVHHYTAQEHNWPLLASAEASHILCTGHEARRASGEGRDRVLCRPVTAVAAAPCETLRAPT